MKKLIRGLAYLALADAIYVAIFTIIQLRKKKNMPESPTRNFSDPSHHEPKIGDFPFQDEGPPPMPASSIPTPTQEQFDSALDVIRELAEDSKDERLRFDAATYLVSRGLSKGMREKDES